MILGIHFNLTAKRGLFNGVGDAMRLFRKGKLPIIPHRGANLSKLMDKVRGVRGDEARLLPGMRGHGHGARAELVHAGCR